ncbi:MAG TPA: hypothetical protein VFY71_01785 [Planctomycetota bacterium]|nr:hypothetical protein [Planctomycetota bacterium]
MHASQGLAALALLLVASCGGGGGGGGSSSSGGGGNPSDKFDPKKDFYLKAGFIARPIFDPTSGELSAIVNPSSLYETDPLTGVPVVGFPKPLIPGASLDTLVSMNFEQILDPLTPQLPLVPRNAAIVLQFSKDVDPASLLVSDLDPANPDLLTTASALQIRRKDGTYVPARATVQGDRIIVYPFVDSAVGWEASPLVFDKFGNPIQDTTGWLRVLTDMGAGLLHSTEGLELVARPDKLGTSLQPLPFNPGNKQLDAIVLQTETGAVGFNGFLPDLTPPRIIRPVTASGSVAATGMSADGLLEIIGAPLATPSNLAANGGLGEWANALLTVTGTGGVVSDYIVERNENDATDPHKPIFVLVAGSVLDPSVVPGATFEVRRSEFYEPIPPPLPTNPDQLAAVTVDPDNHPRDPNDPQDLFNHDLRYFVRMFDENGIELTSVWNPATSKFQLVPPKVSLQLQFSEPMDATAFRPYESFYVADLDSPKTSPAFDEQKIGVVQASADGRTLTFLPILQDQVEPGGDQFIGFGGSPKSLKLVIRTIPEASQIAAVLASVSAAQKAKMVDLDFTGVSGITDLGGRGLGLPKALLDQGDASNFFLQPTSAGLGAFPPAIDFSVGFQTQPTADPDWGAVVHRFMGQAVTSIFAYLAGTVHDTITTGIEYFDHPPVDEDGDGVVDRHFIYGPSLLDVGLNIPGSLTGAPASVLEHLIDDFNKPKASPFASPTGEEDVLSKVGFGTRTPLNSSYGARFQHIYRAGDASPSYNDYAGVVLDLVGLAWSPLNSPVFTSKLEDMEILVGLASTFKGLGPNTSQDNGIPNNPTSGLDEQFDCNLLEWVDACCKDIKDDVTLLTPFVHDEPPITTVVAPGTPYQMQNNKLFRPANAVGLPIGQFNFYLDYPTFNAGIDPAFGKSNVFSFPYDSRFPMIVEYRIKPQDVLPSNGNAFRFSPAILSSVLPRFRVWSQGQSPWAHCVAPCLTICPLTGPKPRCRGGEGGPLLEPGTFTQTVKAPNPLGIQGPNGDQDIVPPPEGYILPPSSGLPDCASLQPVPNWGGLLGGQNQTYLCDGTGPRCNTQPEMNWYWANGMLMYPNPAPNCYPGAQGLPPTAYYGYGPTDGLLTPPTFASGPICPPGSVGFVNEPNYLISPADFGDNSRYHMLWKYRKRVSSIESPTIQADATSVEYHVPFVDPPLADVDPNAGLKVEFRTSTELDFSIPALDSGYVTQSDPNLVELLTGPEANRVYVKFRATFAVAPGQEQPPSIDTVVIPYKKLSP